MVINSLLVATRVQWFEAKTEAKRYNKSNTTNKIFMGGRKNFTEEVRSISEGNEFVVLRTSR
jgi:hypothetical protein